MGILDGLFPRRRRVTEDQETVKLEGGGIRFQAANVQGMGDREGQEDSFALLNAADAAAVRREGLFAVVADGMGGMADGKAVSEGAVDALLQLFHALREEGDVPRQLREGVFAASDGLFQRFMGRGGTTVVAVRIFKGALHWISVGDSAIFLKRNGGVFQLNREHTCLNDLYLQALMEEPVDKAGAETHEDARRLTAFVGMRDLQTADQSLRPLPLKPGDVLLLCSDGISGVLTPAELLEAMSLPPQEGCALLETMVLEKGVPEQDNYTGVMIACTTKDRRDEHETSTDLSHRHGGGPAADRRVPAGHGGL